MSNYIYLFLHFFKGYPVTLSIPATSVSPKTLPGFSLRPLCDTAVLVEHVFETTGSNRAQTRPYGEDTRDLSVRLFTSPSNRAQTRPPGANTRNLSVRLSKITNISQRKHKHFETSSHFLYKIISIKEVTNCDRSEEFSKEIR